jgi:hypothetical protein
MIRALFILCTLFFAGHHSAQAYPQFIGHGYPSCMNCHFNPMGNGPLTDYGRAVGAEGISSGAFYPKTWSEEKITSLSGFLFKNPTQSHIRAQANYRGMEMIQAVSTASEKWSWIHMQASGQLILKFLQDDRLTFVGEFGYNPPSSQARSVGQETKKFRSREHYAGFRVSAEWGVYAGFMDKAYGLRVAEHIAYSRTTPEVTQNDQTHGIMVHGLLKGWEGAFHAYAGNLSQPADQRQKGVSTQIEKTFLTDHRIGGSLLLSQNQYVKLRSYALHSRFSLNDGSALLFEYGQTEKISIGNRGDRIGRYGLLQTYSRPWRGLYFIANIEYQKADLSNSGTSVRWGPGVQYFPIQKLELRTDLYDTRIFNPDASTQDSWMILFQTHVWL